MEAFNSGENSVVIQNSTAVPKKVVWGGNETLLLEKTNKSSPAQAGSPLGKQQCKGVGVCPSSQSSRWESNLGSQPVHPQGLSCTRSTPVPASLLWPGASQNSPKSFGHCIGEGSLLPAGMSITVENPAAFRHFPVIPVTISEKKQSLRHGTPQGL